MNVHDAFKLAYDAEETSKFVKKEHEEDDVLCFSNKSGSIQRQYTRENVIDLLNTWNDYADQSLNTIGIEREQLELAVQSHDHHEVA
ncbi:MAG: hypothetical protein ACRBDL_02985 [Alphaproteobacteria bacterium]